MKYGNKFHQPEDSSQVFCVSDNKYNAIGLESSECKTVATAKIEIIINPAPNK